MPDIYGKLKETYKDMGITFKRGDSGATKLTMPELMLESDDIVNQRRAMIESYNKKILGNRAVGGVIDGAVNSGYGQRILQGVFGESAGGVIGDIGRGAGNQVAWTKQEIANQWSQRAWNELNLELQGRNQMESLYQQRMNIVGQANINEREALAADLLGNNLDAAAQMYRTMSISLGRAAELSEFKQAFDMPSMKISDATFTQIQQVAALRAVDEFETLNIAQREAEPKKYRKRMDRLEQQDEREEAKGAVAPASKVQKEESARAANTAPATTTQAAAPATPAKGPLSEYAEALREANDNPRLQGVSSEQRNQILRNALELKMTSDKMLFFNEFKIRKDLDYKEFKKLDGFENLFKNKNDFEEFEKKVDDKLRTKYAERGIDYVSLSEYHKLKIDDIKQTLAGIGGIERADAAQKGYVPNIGGKVNQIG